MDIGQHVVYVGKTGKFRRCKPLTRGKIYTIRDLFTARDGTACLRLAEVVNGKTISGVEIGYMRKAFRPLDPKRLDQFRQFLANKPTKVEA